jgi:hypothetical protein
MRYTFLIDKWYYDINDCISGYGYILEIYRNDKVVYTQGGYGSIGNAKSYAIKYIIENQFNIDLTEGDEKNG